MRPQLRHFPKSDSFRCPPRRPRTPPPAEPILGSLETVVMDRSFDRVADYEKDIERFRKLAEDS